MKFFSSWLLVLFFGLASLALFEFFWEIRIRANCLAELRNYLHELEEADIAQQRLFFSREFTKAIDENFIAEVNHIKQLNEFKKQPVYPANLTLFLLHHLSCKPSRQVAIVEKKGGYIYLVLKQYPSKPFELCLKFYKTENRLVLVDIDGLAGYFNYLECLRQFSNKNY